MGIISHYGVSFYTIDMQLSMDFFVFRNIYLYFSTLYIKTTLPDLAAWFSFYAKSSALRFRRAEQTVIYRAL